MAWLTLFSLYSHYILSMSEKLTSVIQLMAKANSNLERIAANDEPVQDIAQLWRDAYKSRPGQRKSEQP